MECFLGSRVQNSERSQIISVVNDVFLRYENKQVVSVVNDTIILTS